MKPTPYPGFPFRRVLHPNRPAMTLIEVMASMFVFGFLVLGIFGLLNFGLRTMDDTRAFTQAAQILTHEMEAIRLRSFSGDAGIGQKSVVYLCDHPSDYKQFTAFADYRGGDVAVGKDQPVMSESILGKTQLQLRNATGYSCTRELSYTGTDKDQISVKLVVSWVDGRKAPHSRYLSSSVSKNGLNDSLFLLH